MAHNPMCDGGKCEREVGQVRVLPLNGNANLIVCKACFWHEMAYRKVENRRLGEFAQWDIPMWESLKVYPDPDTSNAQR